MTEQLYEGFGGSNRNDPTTRTKTADASGRLILDLGDRATTLIVDENTTTITLLNKLIETNGSTYKALTQEEAIAAGYGIHVAAGVEDGARHTKKKINVQTEDGSASEELKALFLAAASGGDVGSDSDINLRLGSSSATGTAFVEILVDGKWSTDILRVEGALALELLGLQADPLFTDGNDVVRFDTLVAGDYADGTQYDALGGNDTVYLPTSLSEAAEAGVSMDETFLGGEGNDTFILGDIDTLVDLGAGNDRVVVGAGDDVIAGGDGSFDFIDFSRATGGVTVNLVTGQASGLGNDQISGFETIQTSTFADDVTGTDERESFTLLGGDDLLHAGGGNDQLKAGQGDDTLYGEGSNDTLFSGEGSNYVDGGEGVDLVRFDFVTSGATVDLAAGTAVHSGGQDVLVSIESILGTRFADDLRGDDGNNTVITSGGDDTVFGLGGTDGIVIDGGNVTVFGGDDGDGITVRRADGAMLIDGEAGVDIISFATIGDGVTMDLAAETLEINGISSTLRSVERVILTNQADVFTGGVGDDSVRGGGGDDTLTGGAGADRFAFDLRRDNATDRITDFDVLEDTLRIEASSNFGPAYTGIGDLDLAQVGTDTQITFVNGDVVILENVLATDLTNANLNLFL